MIVLGMPKVDLTAHMDHRGVLRVEHRIRVKLTYFDAEGRIEEVYGRATGWHRSRQEARVEALAMAVAKEHRTALANTVLACR